MYCYHLVAQIDTLLVIDKIVLRRDEKTYTALVRYDREPGFLKCTKVKEAFDSERIALETIRAGDPSDTGIKKAFVSLMGVFPPKNGKYCLLVTRVIGDSLDVPLPVGGACHCSDIPSGAVTNISLRIGIKYMHSLGLVHGDIKPQNIMIDSSQKGRPIVTIIDFDMSQMVGRSGMGFPYGGTLGYLAPEDFLGRPADQYKRDTWMMGATLYAALTKRPPLPFRHLLQKIRIMGKSIHVPVRSAKNRQLVGLMEKMMTFEIAQRPRLSELNDPLLKPFATTAPVA
ncbi:kinase-like domain-containing protein [Thamnocephalis sphaerospora]|uniref:Kinase-like domain-containing protein n=1 Tax=Thamnocephalis sphaerospora TaxID=78915 RepID=A0A4P9XH14_9FUNG|nr:kinase-like domain-containing protein [Thamnocephalis sphaerospora]|eukprot:RKP04943.1 kinase-like domain-containing protein [Thamnocephalis sphaerospora]